MSRTDPNKGLTTDYPGDSNCVLVELLIIGTANHLPNERTTSITYRGMIKDHHSGLTVINDNRSGLSINPQTC